MTGPWPETRTRGCCAVILPSRRLSCAPAGGGIPARGVRARAEDRAATPSSPALAAVFQGIHAAGRLRVEPAGRRARALRAVQVAAGPCKRAPALMRIISAANRAARALQSQRRHSTTEGQSGAATRSIVTPTGSLQIQPLMSRCGGLARDQHVWPGLAGGPGAGRGARPGQRHVLIELVTMNHWHVTRPGRRPRRACHHRDGRRGGRGGDPPAAGSRLPGSPRRLGRRRRPRAGANLNSRACQ